MIPLFKIFVIITKTFTKPVISQTKGWVKAARPGFITRNFVWIGHKAHFYEMVINKKFFGMKINMERMKKLTDEEAMEYAINFFLEVVVLYGVILGLALLELKKSHESSQKEKDEKAKLKSQVSTMETELNDVKQLLLQVKDSIPNLNPTPPISNNEGQSAADLMEKVKLLEESSHKSQEATTKFIKEFTERLTLHKNVTNDQNP